MTAVARWEKMHQGVSMRKEIVVTKRLGDDGGRRASVRGRGDVSPARGQETTTACPRGDPQT